MGMARNHLTPAECGTENILMHLMKLHKPASHRHLALPLRALGEIWGAPGAITLAHALRLIHRCFTLFVSMCSSFLNGCALSACKELLFTHSE